MEVDEQPTITLSNQATKLNIPKTTTSTINSQSSIAENVLPCVTQNLSPQNEVTYTTQNSNNTSKNEANSEVLPGSDIITSSDMQPATSTLIPRKKLKIHKPLIIKDVEHMLDETLYDADRIIHNYDWNPSVEATRENSINKEYLLHNFGIDKCQSIALRVSINSYKYY
jgi:hypothetical protein